MTSPKSESRRPFLPPLNIATDWAKARAIEITSLQQLRINQIEDHEILCQQCCLGAEESMLCSGMKPFFSITDSEYYGAVKIGESSCHKLKYKERDKLLKGRLKSSLLPTPIIDSHLFGNAHTPIVEIKDGKFIVDEVETPWVCWNESNIKLTRAMFGVMVALCQQGASPKWLYPQHWYSDWRRHEELGFNELSSCDWLYVEGMDARNGTDYSRLQLFSAVQQRVAAGMPTVITLSSIPLGRTETEEAFLKEIRTWPKLPKKLYL